MLHFYGFPSPNALKVAVMLEACAADYEAHFVDILSGGQFASDFLAISPNNKVPALVDTTAPGEPISLFESGVILEYLGEKTGWYFNPRRRWEIKCWLAWQMAGLGPMAGQAHHFRMFATEASPYGVKRYTDEVNRLYGVLDRRLEGRDFIVDQISIADFACWPWVRHYEWQGQTLDDFPNIRRWFDDISAMNFVTRALNLWEEQMAPRDAYKILYGQTSKTAKGFSRKSAK